MRRAVFIIGLLLPLATLAQDSPFTPTPPPELIRSAVSRGIKTAEADPNQNVFIYSFTRGGTLRESLVLLPGGVFETDTMNLPSRGCVSVRAAMPWNLGDGAILSVWIERRNQRELAVELPLDPAHVREHRDWVPIRFDLPSDPDGLRLVFGVEAGPRGDQTGDWVGLTDGNDLECFFGTAVTD